MNGRAAGVLTRPRIAKLDAVGNWLLPFRLFRLLNGYFERIM